ncbi:Uncharacterised protein [Leminorella richardii]|uniref:Uncharacterized protein n=1 Tax=Leminorella richardii TaxID=158841 RepID=A0A2X4ULF0_9GAMM|nr:hypothetical protein [Leminorella richardii]SQI40746.1 Uncharacterised protein [Leminorella richardii]
MIKQLLVLTSLCGCFAVQAQEYIPEIPAVHHAEERFNCKAFNAPADNPTAGKWDGMYYSVFDMGDEFLVGHSGKWKYRSPKLIQYKNQRIMAVDAMRYGVVDTSSGRAFFIGDRSKNAMILFSECEKIQKKA